MVNQLVLPFIELTDSGLFGLQFVNEKHFVVQMLAIVSLQIHLLQPHAAIVHFLLCSHALIEGCLAVGHIVGALLYALPPLFQ